MRFVGNVRRRKLRTVPTPLEVCPGRKIWEAHRGSESIIFVDESFHRFFGFDTPDGNFCHGALGVPSHNYARLRGQMQSVVDDYCRKVRRLTGDAAREVKFSMLRRLPLRFRLSFTRELVRGLAGAGGFVAGFFSSTRGTVMEHVRTDLLDAAGEVPNDHHAMYDAARAELRERFQGAGQVELISNLLLTPFSSFVSFLGSFDCVFRVRYDPRQEDEDAAVRDALTNYMGMLVRVPELFGNDPRFLGMDINTPSHDDLGLQLADVVAGEVREFFRNSPEALTESATLRLITPDSDEPHQVFTPLSGRLVKTSVLSPMSPGLARRLVRRNSANLVSYYYPILSSGILSCVTDTGQLRLLEIPTRLVLDALD
jgi:hypothetical protein